MQLDRTIFLPNKYTKWYFQIIENRLNNPLPKEEYGEKHHIIPDCFGGPNTEENLVKLAAPEHLYLHCLLTKMVPDNSWMKWQMDDAYWSMVYFISPKQTGRHGKRYRLTSRMFERARKGMAKANSEMRKGIIFTEEHRKNISKSLTGKPLKRETVEKIIKANTGKKRSPEIKAKFSKIQQELYSNMTEDQRKWRISRLEKPLDLDQIVFELSNTSITLKDLSIKCKINKSSLVERIIKYLGSKEKYQELMDIHKKVIDIEKYPDLEKWKLAFESGKYRSMREMEDTFSIERKQLKELFLRYFYSEKQYLDILNRNNKLQKKRNSQKYAKDKNSKYIFINMEDLRKDILEFKLFPKDIQEKYGISQQTFSRRRKELFPDPIEYSWIMAKSREAFQGGKWKSKEN